MIIFLGRLILCLMKYSKVLMLNRCHFYYNVICGVFKMISIICKWINETFIEDILFNYTPKYGEYRLFLHDLTSLVF